MTAREQALKLLAENPRFVLVEEPGCGHVILGAKDLTQTKEPVGGRIDPQRHAVGRGELGRR
jgi:hypothetical protein